MMGEVLSPSVPFQLRVVEKEDYAGENSERTGKQDPRQTETARILMVVLEEAMLHLEPPPPPQACQAVLLEDRTGEPVVPLVQQVHSTIMQVMVDLQAAVEVEVQVSPKLMVVMEQMEK